MSAQVGERSNAIGLLLHSIVEQFNARLAHGPGDLRQFERLAGDLLDVADDESAARVAQALCEHPETPPSLITRLFARGGACARLAFEFARRAPPAELLAKAEHGSEDVAAAIARRREISREAVAALASRTEPSVLRSLAANRSARFDPGALRALVQAARDDRALARILLDRADIELDPEPLFLAATTSERAAILLAACRIAMASAGDLRGRAPQRDPALGDYLLARAIEQDRETIVTRLADALDARKSRVRGIFEDEGGEALSLAFVALGVNVDASTKIFLCGDWAFARSAARLRELRALIRSAPWQAATRIVAAIVGAPRIERDGPRIGSARPDSAWRRAASGADGARLLERKG
ncbi:MAG TPA: DUF2336 domain-containing protein [Methylocystis sp.]|nr:DUF2336 domain-containing protein [Methylocystis sp.]